MVSRISIQSTKKKKKEYSQNDIGLDVPSVVGSLNCQLGGLIIIVGVEVGEVCVGIGLPGKLWVEVLISFL